MPPAIALLWFLVFILGLALVVKPAVAATDGILIVGTQAEIRMSLRGTRVRASFSEQSPGARVAMRLIENEAAVYEHDSARKILELLAPVVKAGTILTLENGSELWNLLEGTGHAVVQTGEPAGRAVVSLLRQGPMPIVDGVTGTAKTAGQCLQEATDFLRYAFHATY